MFRKIKTRYLFRAALLSFFLVYAIASVLLIVTALELETPVDRPQKVGVVFSHGADRNGGMSEVSRQRVAEALKLYNQGMLGKIICSGGSRPGKVSVAQHMCSYLKEKGVPSELLVVESNSFDSVSNLRCVLSKFANTREEIVLISSLLHGPRLVFLLPRKFTKVGFTSFSHTLEDLLVQPFQSLLEVNHEIMSFAAYVVLGSQVSRDLVSLLRRGKLAEDDLPSDCSQNLEEHS